ncbi:multicopper oxidase family protein [Allostreptomyces psammosilenae]|uniref:Multicopper oxidase CueO n=1 Tax=Allostreptomyces psammosilenae TaxID=1892865 RepID=A0A852ZZ48_9ACTN|nr:multicopper oxidase family protein [Allostreptomyces psammosilenae]NYI07616.1 FtsP/CotA-like multicopper oxidase with cupredoxin domain [Allostreptomyces psammosilenae]
MPTRRNVLKAGAVAGGLLLASQLTRSGSPGAPTGVPAGANGISGGGSHDESHETHEDPPDDGSSSPPHSTLAPFSRPMPLSPTLRPVRRDAEADYYRITMAETEAEILPGMSTPVFTYEGYFPGPTIRAHAGRRVIVEQLNLLDRPTAVHLHGGVVAARDDGNPMDPIPPGGARTYSYPNEQAAAPLWFHDHAHHAESEHVYRGLAGFYLLHDGPERRLGLPGGKFDVPIMIRDAQLGQHGELVYVANNQPGRTTVLVNGVPDPYFTVDARKYRFRLLNAANMGFFRLQLSDGEFVQIGSDRGLLAAPYRTRQLYLSPGERADVVVDFSRYRVGGHVDLCRLATVDAEPVPILRFMVVPATHDPSVVPDHLATLPPVREPDVTRDFSLRTEGTAFTINGRTYDHTRVDTAVRWGDTEEWRVTNDDPMAHNLHLHLVEFRVVDRDGRPPDPGEAGLKDTVRIGPGETVRLRATFDTFEGRYVYHCHLLDHSSMGMMAVMDIGR